MVRHYDACDFDNGFSTSGTIFQRNTKGGFPTALSEIHRSNTLQQQLRHYSPVLKVDFIARSFVMLQNTNRICWCASSVGCQWNERVQSLKKHVAVQVLA